MRESGLGLIGLVRCYCEKLPLISGYSSNNLFGGDDLTAGERAVLSRHCLVCVLCIALVWRVIISGTLRGKRECGDWTDLRQKFTSKRGVGGGGGTRIFRFITQSPCFESDLSRQE